MTENGLEAFCRDCLAPQRRDAPRCSVCASPRLARHRELGDLGIAHIDCDAFYASIEKRDNPAIRHRPVIVGGGRRGVVSAACYLARPYGVRSAMPMFKALRACPRAVVIKPDHKKYSAVGRALREIMLNFTPLVEPLSMDEAFLDLTGTAALHGRVPAQTLALIVQRIEREHGITASIGLSYNKFLAKVASDLDKPRGFAAIGQAEAVAFLAGQPISVLWGVGKALQARLRRDGIRTMGDLTAFEEAELMARYGAMGQRMFRFARGQDSRQVNPRAPAKSISAETTFNHDLGDQASLEPILWRLCEKVSLRLKRSELAAGTVVLKLRAADFRIRTRSRTLAAPTQLADRLYRHGLDLLAPEIDGTAFRLIGIGGQNLEDPRRADPPDLADHAAGERAQAERTVDRIRARFGDAAIGKGRGFRARKD